MSAPAETLTPELTEIRSSESLWSKAWYKFRRDRAGMWSPQ
jgi:hypothetical protein